MSVCPVLIQLAQNSRPVCLLELSSGRFLCASINSLHWRTCPCYREQPAQCESYGWRAVECYGRVLDWLEDRVTVGAVWKTRAAEEGTSVIMQTQHTEYYRHWQDWKKGTYWPSICASYYDHHDWQSWDCFCTHWQHWEMHWDLRWGWNSINLPVDRGQRWWGGLIWSHSSDTAVHWLGEVWLNTTAGP